jgi:hypothetical protein
LACKRLAHHAPLCIKREWPGQSPAIDAELETKDV